MVKDSNAYSQELIEHFFRNEYGRMVSVFTKYIGTKNVKTAEDIVQETLLKAVKHWQHNGIPENPKAWLYTTAKNLTINFLKRKKYQSEFNDLTLAHYSQEFEKLQISEEFIADEQLKMMFACCHPKISKNSQICLILKILCGFSISEIANAFFSSTDTINKRLVRGRKQLRSENVNFRLPKDLNKRLPVVLKTIFLLFNEGYNPTEKNELIRYGLCLEAIRLCELLVSSTIIEEKSNCHALIALMYLNASRFDSRMNSSNYIIEMNKQDRTSWNQELINKGIHNLNQAINKNEISVYLILATISANHCIAPSFEKTNWKEILSLYENLIKLEDSPVARLNRSVALAKVKGNKMAILELENLQETTRIGRSHLFYSTIAEFYKMENNMKKAKENYKKAIALTKNKRDLKILQKKLMEAVPN